MLPRLRPQRAMLTAWLLVPAGCTIGGANAIAPPESDVGDGDAISVSESPAIENGHDASDEQFEQPDAGRDAAAEEDGGDACEGELCGELPDGCTSDQFDGHAYLFCLAQLTWDGARTACRELQLDLVIIETAAEN